MENIKLFESELKIMEILWENEEITAKELSRLAEEKIGWNKNTTYTIVRKLVKKKAVKREEPNFVCTTLITKEEVGFEETKELVDKLFDHSIKHLLASFIQKEKLSKDEIKELRELIDQYPKEG